MQKAYSRVNWKNEPSLDTPLGANNLNKMDSALDVIDNRVLSLSGYEGRVQASEKNAKASEVNAKTSENNAKESEELAKQYMESAFDTTPEGYAEIVDKVEKMDIQESTSTTLLDSKDGGYKLLSMSGNSVQNGTPTPDAPQSINNVGDCVEMMQGTLSSTTGEWVTSTTRICSKNPIPCKSGDVVRIETESSKGLLLIAYYNEGGFVSVSNLANVSVANFTVPTNVTKFKIVVGDNNGITPSTVGKILLTINGKYVVQIVESGKNLLQNKASTTTSNGVTFTVNDDGSVKANGTASGTAYITLVTKMPLKKGAKYIFSGCPSGGTTTTYSSIITIYGTSTKTIYDRGSSVEYTCEEDNVTYTYQTVVFNGAKVSDLTFYPMLRYADITDDTYEPYKEKAATVLLNAPLRDTDVMSRTEVVRNRVVKKASELSWGASTNNPHLFVTASFTSDCVCTHFTDTKDSRINGDYFANMYLASGQCSKRHGTVDRVYFKLDSVSTLEEWKSWIAENDFIVEYELATPIVETLDSTSQIALNSLETFDSVTYINVDSITQPKGINGEYGTSKVGARTIKNELKNDTLEIKYNELAVALVATESGV